jgi:hypothetical protein
MFVPKMVTTGDAVVGKQYLDTFIGTAALYVNTWLEEPMLLLVVTVPESLFPVPPGNLDGKLLSLTQREAELSVWPILILKE